MHTDRDIKSQLYAIILFLEVNLYLVLQGLHHIRVLLRNKSLVGFELLVVAMIQCSHPPTLYVYE